MTADTWQPGDPLHNHHEDGGASYRQGLYTFRLDQDTPECGGLCGDAASWPNPKPHHRLRDDIDELEEFIAGVRRDEARAAASRALQETT